MNEEPTPEPTPTPGTVEPTTEQQTVASLQHIEQQNERMIYQNDMQLLFLVTAMFAMLIRALRK